MTEEARCICCDLLLSSCGKAIEEERATATRTATRRTKGTELEARFAGFCVDCRTPFPVGALIEYDPEIGGYRALDCCP